MTAPKAPGSRKPGNPSILESGAAEELERLWVETDVKLSDLTVMLNERFNLDLSPNTVRNWATDRGFNRTAIASVYNSPTVTEDRVRLEEFERWASPPAPPPDNPVRRVARGTFPARGFTMLRRTG